MNAEFLTYSELQREVLQALRTQHPEWVQPDGASPIYDHYEARLAELLGIAIARRPEAVPGCGLCRACYEVDEAPEMLLAPRDDAETH